MVSRCEEEAAAEKGLPPKDLPVLGGVVTDLLPGLTQLDPPRPHLIELGTNEEGQKGAPPGQKGYPLRGGLVRPGRLHFVSPTIGAAPALEAEPMKHAPRVEAVAAGEDVEGLLLRRAGTNGAVLLAPFSHATRGRSADGLAHFSSRYLQTD